MDQSSPPKNALDPQTLHFEVRADQPFFCFNDGDVTVIPLTLSVGKGAPLTLHDDSPDQVRIGARLYVNEGSADEPLPGALLGEYRADSAPFTAQKALHYTRSMTVGIPSGVPGELLLDLDLVKEGHFWGADLGHKPVRLILTQRRVAIRPAQPDPLDMTETLMQLHDARAREARYEAVIFSLLNQLSKRDA
jgi:hypothetical protein